MPLIRSVKAVFTRPANHAANAQYDAVSNSASAPSPLTFKLDLPANAWLWLVGVKITDSDVATVAAEWRLYLLNGDGPPLDTGAAFDDNAALALPEAMTTGVKYGTDLVQGGRVNELQTVISLDTAMNTGLNQVYEYWTPPVGIKTGASGDLYGILQVNNAYDPSANSNTITVELILEADQT
jgi:hypothetical protein